MDQEVAEGEPMPAVPALAAKPSIARNCLLRGGILVGSRDKKALAEFRALASNDPVNLAMDNLAAEVAIPRFANPSDYPVASAAAIGECARIIVREGAITEYACDK